MQQMLDFNTPYSAYYIGKPNLIDREEIHIIHVEENPPYGIKIVSGNFEMPLASLKSVERYWKIEE